MSMVMAGRFLDRFAADAAVSALRGSGIQAELFDDFVPGVASLGPGEGSGVRVMVPADRFEDAAALLAEAEAAGGAGKTPLKRTFGQDAPLLLAGALLLFFVAVGLGRVLLS